ncbi:MAG: DUF1559 domain-containing protein [Candidatus Nealsonbacteria bacterium]|nr:DUF1559 domain-containing protein [Candidatus Nealsonbacteria bacterium]
MSRTYRATICYVLTLAMVWSPSLVYGQPPAAKSDLSYVTPTAAFAAVARPRRVLTAPEMAMLPIEVISAAGKKELGIDPLDIEQIMVVANPPQPPLPPGAGLVIRFSKPYAMEGLLPPIAEQTVAAQLDGKPYRRGQGPMAPSMFMPDDRTLIVATDQMLQEMVANSKQPVAGKMSRTLAAAGGSNDFMAILLVEPLRPLVAPALAAAPLPPQFADAKKVRELLSVVALRLNLIGNTEIALVLRANDEAAAKELEALANRSIDFAGQMLQAQMAAEMTGDDPVEQAMKQYMTRMSKQTLDALRPVRKGNCLELSGSGQQNMQIATIGVLVALLLPAIQAAREAARRTQSMNHLKQLGIAMLTHEMNLKTLPARASFDGEGKPLLSWRVHLLPYLDQQQLYDQFKLDEPWDSEHNKKLIPQMPALFINPSSAAGPGLTTYLVPVGKGTVFESDKGLTLDLLSARDGTSNTIMVVEANDDQAVVWTKPDDWQYDAEKPLAGLGNAHPGGFGALFADGSVHFISADVDPTVFRALLTYMGGERVGNF